MSHALIDRSPDLTRLREEGYDIEIRANLLLVKQVPYVTAQKAVARGTLVSTLTTSGDVTTNPVQDHTAYFVGELPCNHLGQPLNTIINPAGTHDLGGGVVACCRFSGKLPGGVDYPNYHAKMTNYVNILANYARAIEPGVTAQVFPPITTDEDESVFRYLDSASSRAEIGAITDRLRVGKVAIVGLGGTGSYILDLIAKTPVQQIHLYDGDTLYTHNAFRAPGAASVEELRASPKKVDYFQRKYDPMRRNIIAHPVYVDEANVEELRDMAVVFLAMDAGPSKKHIITKLEEFGVSFIDAGMGIYRAGNSLGGQVRATTSTPGHRQHISKRVSFARPDDEEYDHNIQIADLNMLNAFMAVSRWKRLVGFYADLGGEYSSTYKITHNRLINEDHEECGE